MRARTLLYSEPALAIRSKAPRLVPSIGFVLSIRHESKRSRRENRGFSTVDTLPPRPFSPRELTAWSAKPPLRYLRSARHMARLRGWSLDAYWVAFDAYWVALQTQRLSRHHWPHRPAGRLGFFSGYPNSEITRLTNKQVRKLVFLSSLFGPKRTRHRVRPTHSQEKSTTQHGAPPRLSGTRAYTHPAC